MIISHTHFSAISSKALLFPRRLSNPVTIGRPSGENGDENNSKSGGKKGRLSATLKNMHSSFAQHMRLFALIVFIIFGVMCLFLGVWLFVALFGKAAVSSSFVGFSRVDTYVGNATTIVPVSTVVIG